GKTRTDPGSNSRDRRGRTLRGFPRPTERAQLLDLRLPSDLQRVRCLGRREHAVEHRYDLVLRNGADNLLDDFSTFEDVEAGDAADRVLCRDPLVLIHVDLGDFDLPLVLLRDLLDDGGDDPAGAAPLGPEIHQNRDLRIQHLGFERAIAYLDDRIRHGPRLLTR